MIDILNQFWRAFLYWDGQRISGLAVTLWLLVASVGIGFVMAIPLAVARVSKKRWLSTPVRLYTYVFRGTPLYVQLLLIYNMLPAIGLNVPSIVAAIIGLSLCTAAYQAENMRGGFASVPIGLVESAEMVGLSLGRLRRLPRQPQHHVARVGVGRQRV